jgi:hypothetical protein
VTKANNNTINKYKIYIKFDLIAKFYKIMIVRTTNNCILNHVKIFKNNQDKRFKLLDQRHAL